MKEVNINCDLGEGVLSEPLLLPLIYSCSVACGGHYGDETSIMATLKRAKLHQVKVGAHPSYPDKEHFGRKSMDLPKSDFQESIQGQLERYYKCLNEVKLGNHHIKAHGALYNDLARNTELCEWYLEVLKAFDFGVIYTPYNSTLAKLAEEYGMEVLNEVFLDRNYMADGQLVPRSHPRALKTEPEEVWLQLKSFIEKEGVKTLEGQWMHLPAKTYCLHGDHPKVLEFLQYIHQRLKETK